MLKKLVVSLLSTFCIAVSSWLCAMLIKEKNRINNTDAIAFIFYFVFEIIFYLA